MTLGVPTTRPAVPAAAVWSRRRRGPAGSRPRRSGRSSLTDGTVTPRAGRGVPPRRPAARRRRRRSSSSTPSPARPTRPATGGRRSSARAGPWIRPVRRAVRQPARRSLRHDRADLDRPGDRRPVRCDASRGSRRATRPAPCGGCSTPSASTRLALVAGGSLGGMVALEVALASGRGRPATSCRSPRRPRRGRWPSPGTTSRSGSSTGSATTGWRSRASWR